MRDTVGNAVTLTLFGESHGPAVGVVIEGLAAGLPVDAVHMAAQMDKRRAVGKLSTQRTEADEVHFISGVYEGHTTGTALTLLVENTNTKSADYSKTQDLLRPGHADYTAHMKYHGYQDARGGGHFSGRLTAPLVAAGALFLDMLAARGIVVGTHLAACAGVQDTDLSSEESTLRAQLQQLNSMRFAALSQERAAQMTQAIERAAAEGDSVGGVLETAVCGLPAGVGEPFFTSVESVLASLLFSMPAVKGVEFGLGFGFAALHGSEANDAFCMRAGAVATATNHNGGINGGIANGMPLLLRTVVKPTPSIYKQQNTVDYAKKQDAQLQISGRHDPCIVHRARVVQDSLVAFGLVDLLTVQGGTKWQEGVWNTD